MTVGKDDDDDEWMEKNVPGRQEKRGETSRAEKGAFAQTFLSIITRQHQHTLKDSVCIMADPPLVFPSSVVRVSAVRNLPTALQLRSATFQYAVTRAPIRRSACCRCRGASTPYKLWSKCTEEKVG